LIERMSPFTTKHKRFCLTTLQQLFFRKLSIYLIRDVASVCSCHSMMKRNSRRGRESSSFPLIVRHEFGAFDACFSSLLDSQKVRFRDRKPGSSQSRNPTESAKISQPSARGWTAGSIQRGDPARRALPPQVGKNALQATHWRESRMNTVHCYD